MGAAAMTDFSETQGGWSNDPVAIKANRTDWRVRAHASELADKNWGGFVWRGGFERGAGHCYQSRLANTYTLNRCKTDATGFVSGRLLETKKPAQAPAREFITQQL